MVGIPLYYLGICICVYVSGSSNLGAKFVSPPSSAFRHGKWINHFLPLSTYFPPSQVNPILSCIPSFSLTLTPATARVVQPKQVSNVRIVFSFSFESIDFLLHSAFRFSRGKTVFLFQRKIVSKLQIMWVLERTLNVELCFVFFYTF